LNLYGLEIDYYIINVCKANRWIYCPWGVVSGNGIKGFKKKGETIEQKDCLRQPIQKTTPEVQEKLLKKSGQLSLFEALEK